MAAQIPVFHRSCTLLRRVGGIFLLLLFAVSGVAAAPLPCAAEGALPTTVLSVSEEGLMPVSDGLALRLAGIVWPDHLEPGRRRRVAGAIAEALAGQEVRWKPAAGPDRWGRVPAHLFIREPDGHLAPFWLQAGLVEAGLVPAWPEPEHAECWALLLRHEAVAIRARRGHWAPRAQAERHRVVESARERHAGRRMAALWQVRSVRKWRNLVFVNFAPSFRGAPSLGLTARQVSRLRDSGLDPAGWTGKRVVARFIVGGGGLSRLRVETPWHIAPVE